MPKIAAAATIRTPTKATLPRPAAVSRPVALATKDTIRPHRQGHEKHAERYCGRPGRAKEGRRQAFDDAERHRRDHHAGKAAEPAQYADREDPADVFTANRRLDRLDDD